MTIRVVGLLCLIIFLDAVSIVDALFGSLSTVHIIIMCCSYNYIIIMQSLLFMGYGDF